MGDVVIMNFERRVEFKRSWKIIIRMMRTNVKIQSISRNDVRLGSRKENKTKQKLLIRRVEGESAMARRDRLLSLSARRRMKQSNDITGRGELAIETELQIGKV